MHHQVTENSHAETKKGLDFANAMIQKPKKIPLAFGQSNRLECVNSLKVLPRTAGKRSTRVDRGRRNLNHAHTILTQVYHLGFGSSKQGSSPGSPGVGPSWDWQFAA